MAKIVLSAKPSDQWTFIELKGLNIRIEAVAAPSFFGSALPDSPDRPDAISKTIASFLDTCGTPLVVSPSVRLQTGLVHQRMELDLMMCGQWVTAKPDVVIMNDQDYILLVQRYMPQAEAEPQLIAAAIAAHYENNRRLRTLGLPIVAAKAFAGIIMIGTAPTFYQNPRF
ncbi:hypothetical protein B0H14DRAFT_3894394 [Mycena olivaceomarginata]|nr:hypothetical protein B0H14DRAFT_3894394 [Mycena olivaceomarginata]